MKTSQIARGIVGALSLAGVIGAIGCSADAGYEGAAGEGEIGETSQALINGANDTNANLAAAIDESGVSINPDPAGLEFSAHCQIEVNGTLKMIAIGGFLSSGASTSAVYVLTPGTGYQRVLSLANARGYAKAIRNPADPKQCLVVGGTTHKTTSPADVTTAELISVDAGGTTWNKANAGTVAGTIDFALTRCGSSDVIKIGGENAAGTLQTEILKWNGSNAFASLQNTNGTPANVALTVARSGFAFADQDESTHSKFLIAGGKVAGSASDRVEAFKVTSGCALDSTSATTPTSLSVAGTPATFLNTPRIGAVAFPTAFASNIGSVTVVSGRNGGGSPALQLTQENMTIDWSGSAPVYRVSPSGRPAQVTPASPALVGTQFPELVRVSQFTWLIAGGEEVNATFHAGPAISATSALQEYSGATFVASSPKNLATGRMAFIAENLGGTVYAGLGRDPSNNFLTITETTTVP